MRHYMHKNCNCAVTWNYNMNMNEKFNQAIYFLLWVTWNAVLFWLSYIMKSDIMKSYIFQRKKTSRGDEPNVSGTTECTVLLRGASKIKLKKVNKKRTVTVRRVIIFLNISRHPLLICLQCCLHQYKTLKAVAMAMATAAIVLLTPAKNLKKVFWGF